MMMVRSTTPRSAICTDPDENDRVMGVTSACSRETVRFGEEKVLGLEVNQDGVANNSVDLDQAQEHVNLCHESDSGAGGSFEGNWQCIFECLDRMGRNSNIANPATLASEEGCVGSSPHANPRQVMSPNSSQTPSYSMTHETSDLPWSVCAT